MTSVTISTATTSAISTSWMAPSMKTASSLVILSWVPSGKTLPSWPTICFTPAEMSSVLDWAWRMMPRPMPCRPLERSAVEPSSGPSVTMATSPRRTRFFRIRFSKSAGLTRSAVARTVMSWLWLFREPAGTSKAAVASALRRSATVRPRAASFDWSTSTRKIFSWSP